MKITIPTSLGELSREDLASLEVQLQEAITTAVVRGEELTSDDRENAVSLTAVTAELDRRESIEGLTETITSAVVDRFAAHLGATAVVEDDDDVEDDEDVEADEVVAEDTDEPAAVSAGELAAHDPVVEVDAPARQRVTRLVTSTATRSSGEELASSVDLAEVYHEVARTMQDGDTRLIARLDTTEDVTLGDDPAENSEMISELISRGQNEGAEALVASGGWMTPSEISYAFFEPETMAGLLDTPTVGVNRGGLRHITNGGPQIGDAITTGAAAFWVWDETTDITPASTVKTRYKIPAPTWTDVRLAAYGVALDHGNLAARSFPELTARWMRLAPVAHEHEINRIRIAAIATASTALDFSTGYAGGDAATVLLDVAEQQATKLREKYRMGFNTVVDSVFPDWVLGAIRATMSRRSGFNGIGVASDDVIRSWFFERNIRPQFLYDWQALPSASKTWESATAGKVDFLIYPSGTWVTGKGGSLDLGLHRDSTLNETNDHTALWTEQFLSLMRFGPESRKVTVNVQLDGETYDFVTAA